MPHLVHSASRVPGKTLEPDSVMNGKALEARSGPKTVGQIRLPFFYGWLLVGGSFVTMAIGVNARTAYSLLFPQILDEFGCDRGVTAGAFSFGFLVSAVVTPCVGWLTDRQGPRLVIETGVVLMGTGLLLATLIREPWQLYLTLGALVGGVNLLAYTGQSLYLTNWFVRPRAGWR
jgi:MFS family permease